VTVGTRLKRAGMHWSLRGANAIIALRSCRLSGRFEDFWARRAEGRVTHHFNVVRPSMHQEVHRRAYNTQVLSYMPPVPIPMQVISDSDLIPGAGSDAMAVTVGAKHRWSCYVLEVTRIDLPEILYHRR